MFTIQKNARTENWGGVTAVFAEGTAELTLRLLPQVPVKRYMAVYRHTESWCRPFFGTDLRQIPADTVLLVLELEQDFCALVPVVNDLCRTTLEADLTARMTTWSDAPCRGLALVYAVGAEPTALIHDCVAAALEIMGSHTPLRQQRSYPENLEYLGWCSWDSMQIRVCEEGLLRKCEELREKNIPIKWAIIDDMWAEIRDFYGKTYEDFHEMVKLMHSSRLYSFEADPLRFPNGLKHCIDGIKVFGMQVGMWFPVKGYWAGLDETGPAYRTLEPHLLKSNMGHWVANWEYPHARAWFDHLMGALEAAGADFVKTDNQGMLRRNYAGSAAIGRIAKEFHGAMEDAAKTHFDSRMIDCMGMAPENVWSRKYSAVSRCSDDFLPENKAWFTKHVLQCAYNSLWQGQFYWCDWDMWWTDDGQAEKNALMRAVSGGPVYVSDQLERSRPEILKPLATADGRVLRCDRPAMPTADCVTVDPTVSGQAMKIQNMAGSHGVLAVLNLDADGAPVTATIRSEDIPGFAAEEYAVYEHFSGACRVLKRGESFVVTLRDDSDYRLYIFAPVVDGFAAIGRTDKYISPKTIADVRNGHMELTEDGPCAWVQDGCLHRKG